MDKKRKILLLQWPFSMGSDSYFFEQFGFSVRCEHVVSFDYLVEHINSRAESLDGFDFIVLSILGSPNCSKVIFPPDKIEKLKTTINNLSTHQEKSISLIGMHMCVDKNLKGQQISLFDGMFIDEETTGEQIMEILRLD